MENAKQCESLENSDDKPLRLSLIFSSYQYLVSPPQWVVLKQISKR